MNIACPIDGKDDTIQKVSAVVMSGQSTGTFAGTTGGTVSIDGKSGSISGYSTLSGSSVSSLAKLLSPPVEPTKPKGIGFVWVALFFIPMFVSNILYSISGESRNIFILALVVAGGIITFLVLLKYLIKFNKWQIEQSTIRYTKEKQAWDKAMDKWNKSYYCHKHDVVFDSESGESCPPTSLKEFLYKSKSG